jgi:hypothetical protein
MKDYIASYQNDKDECWDIVFEAEGYKDARKYARSRQKEMGRLYSVRLKK